MSGVPPAMSLYPCTSCQLHTSLSQIRPGHQVARRKLRPTRVAGEGRSANRTKWTVQETPRSPATAYAPKTSLDEGYAANLVGLKPGDTCTAEAATWTASCMHATVLHQPAQPRYGPDAIGMAGVTGSAANLCWYRSAGGSKPTQSAISHEKAQNRSSSFQRLNWLWTW